MGISIGIKISSQRRTSLNQNSFSLSKYFAVITESGANINKSSLPFLKGEKIAIAIAVSYTHLTLPTICSV